MESPLSPMVETEENNNKETKIFEITSEKNRKFTISFSQDINTVKINGSYQENSILFDYEGTQALENLKRFKTFRGFDSLEEILDEIYNFIDNKKIKIFEYDNKIDLIILLPFKKEEKLIISLERKINDKQIIKEQKLKIEKLEKSRKELNEKYDSLEKSIKNKYKKNIDIDKDEQDDKYLYIKYRFEKNKKFQEKDMKCDKYITISDLKKIIIRKFELSKK